MKAKNKFIIFFLVFSFLLTSGASCKRTNKSVRKAMEPITLNYWRVWDGPDDFKDIIDKYNARHPNISIKYRKFRYNEYEQALLEAMAEDRGPDIFSIHNTWVRKYKRKIKPMPPKTTLAYQYTKGSIKKETFTELRTTKSITPKDIKTDFIDVVYDDVVIRDKNPETQKTQDLIYGLPLAADTLVMYYNKDLLNNAGIAEPPLFWNREFQQDVKKLTKQDAKGRIIQSGVALGGSDNIERATDILSVLMMQNGAVMTENNAVSFHQPPAIFREKGYNPGLEALRFYTDFANPSKEVYSWNSELDNSLDMFIRGELAFMFGYSYHLPIIKSRAPKLNFMVNKLPQIEGNLPVNFANYWVETVSKKSKYPDAAWDFIQFAARAENVKSYLDKTKKPTVLRSLINEQIKNPDIGIFADQILTAKSWYRGVDPSAAEKILKDMINDVVLGRREIEESIVFGARRVQQTIGK